MSNTLRRKMFKLGGSANTHGVGITSGLKMNKGGRVKMQPGGFVPPKALSGGSILSSLLARETPQQTYLRKRDQKSQERVDAVKDFVGQYFTDVPFGQLVSDVGKAGTAQAGGLYDLLIGNPASAATEFFTGVNPEFTARKLIGAEDGDPIVDLAGMLLSEKKDKDKDKDEKVTKEAEKSPAQILKEIQDNIEKNKTTEVKSADVEPSEIEKEESINNAVKNIDDDDALDFESPEDQLSFEDQVKRRAELYKNLMETDDKQKGLAQAILAGSTALLEGGGSESYAKAGKAVGDVLSNQADSLRNLRNAATTQAISDVTSTDATIRAAENQARLLNIREDRTDARAEKTLELQRKKQEATDEKTRLTGIIALEESYGDQAPDQYKRLFEGAGDFELMPIETTGDKKGSFDDDVLKAKGEGKTYIYNGDFYVYLSGELQNLGSDLTAAQNILESFKKQLRG